MGIDLGMSMDDRFWAAVQAVEGARGVRIDPVAKVQLSELLQTALDRIERGEATEDQFDAATVQLERGLMEAPLEMRSDGEAVLTTLSVGSALRGLCPLWPFC